MFGHEEALGITSTVDLDRAEFRCACLQRDLVKHELGFWDIGSQNQS